MLLFVTVEAAAHNLTLIPLSNSEVIATWDVNPDLFELNNFIVTYFIKPEQQEISNVTTTYFQISDLIPGETYIVCVTAQYRETTGSSVIPADPTEESITLEKIGMLPLKIEKRNTRNKTMFNS